MWVIHDDVFYNLDKYVQIQRGDEDEIILSTEVHNMDWEDEEKLCILRFQSYESREQAWNKLQYLLDRK